MLKQQFLFNLLLSFVLDLLQCFFSLVLSFLFSYNLVTNFLTNNKHYKLHDNCLCLSYIAFSTLA